MTVPQAYHDPAIWQAAHLRRYARACGRLEQAYGSSTSITDMHIKTEAVYIALGSPLGRRVPGLLIWVGHQTWATPN